LNPWHSGHCVSSHPSPSITAFLNLSAQHHDSGLSHRANSPLPLTFHTSMMSFTLLGNLCALQTWEKPDFLLFVVLVGAGPSCRSVPHLGFMRLQARCSRAAPRHDAHVQAKHSSSSSSSSSSARSARQSSEAKGQEEC